MMNWNQSELERLFGCNGVVGGPPTDLIFFDYFSARLRYTIIVHPTEEQVSISADPETPFGAHSLYEVYVPCNAITLMQDPYRPGEQGIACWYGMAGNEMDRTLTILWRPDGDLKVWPQGYFPPEHVSRKAERTGETPGGPAASQAIS